MKLAEEMWLSCSDGAEGEVFRLGIQLRNIDSPCFCPQFVFAMAMNSKTGAVATPVQLGSLLAKSGRYAAGSQALALRHSDKVDYSVSRGGFRLWAVILLFLLLTGGLVTLVSQGDLDEGAESLNAELEGENDQETVDEVDDSQPSAVRGRMFTGDSESLTEPPVTTIKDPGIQPGRRSKRKAVEVAVSQAESREAVEEADHREISSDDTEDLSEPPIQAGEPLADRPHPVETEIRVIRRKGVVAPPKPSLIHPPSTSPEDLLPEWRQDIKISRSEETAKLPHTEEPVKSVRKKGNPPKAPVEKHREPIEKVQEVEASTLRHIYATIKGLVIKPPTQDIPVRSFRKKGSVSRPTPSSADADLAEDHSEQVEAEEEEEEVEVEEQVAPVKEIPLRPRKVSKAKSSAVPNYKKAEITNRADFKIRVALDEADRLLLEAHYDEALAAFDQILKESPLSPRAHYGRAKSHDVLSERRQSNPLLELAIKQYEQLLHLPSVPEELYLQTVARLVDRCRFRGWLAKAALHQRRAVDLFPDVSHQIGLGETYLMMGRYEDAKNIFENIIHTDPNNGLAHVLYGFILKTVDDQLAEAIRHLQLGINSDEEGTQEHRYFYHLGDALQRLGRSSEALRIYELAASKGLFVSAFQRSVHNVPGLKANPIWSVADTSYAQFLNKLEIDWRAIRDEALALLHAGDQFLPVDSKLMLKGETKYFLLRSKGSAVPGNCLKAPTTCALLEAIPPARTCKRGEAKFLLLNSAAESWPHCGPTNCRLRAQLGLQVPPGCSMRVANKTVGWRTGKLTVFDDSFEHQLRNEGKSSLLLLSVDLWHPELNVDQRVSLGPL